MPVLMGIDVGQGRNPTAICVAETETRDTVNGSAVHFLVRLLERLPNGTSFPEAAQRVAEITGGIERRADSSLKVFVNVTGKGQPIVDILDEAIPEVRTVTAVFFSHGDRREEIGSGWHPKVHLGKAYLVCRLQALLQTRRLHLPRTAEAETLAHELLEYKVKVEEDANDRYGAFRVGSHDDLVTALGLAVQQDPIGPGIF